ncbi:MAG: MbnP family protein [Flavobacteriales bacterium]
MRKAIPLIAAVSLAAACRKDSPIEPAPPTEATVRLRVVPEWGGQPFSTFVEYRAPGDIRFMAEMLRFYLSDIRVVAADGSDAPLSQVKLIDLGNGPMTIEMAAPAGTWLGLRAGLGLPHDLNHTDPVLYGADHPMSVNTGMYWTWASGYKFILFDGRFNPDPASTAPLLSAFSVHTGMDTCYTTLDLFPALPFSTERGEATGLTLRVAVDGFLQTPEETIDVVTENQAHGSNYPLALKLTRNAKRSISIETD